MRFVPFGAILCHVRVCGTTHSTTVDRRRASRDARTHRPSPVRSGSARSRTQSDRPQPGPRDATDYTCSLFGCYFLVCCFSAQPQAHITIFQRNFPLLYQIPRGTGPRDPTGPIQGTQDAVSLLTVKAETSTIGTASVRRVWTTTLGLGLGFGYRD